MLRVLYADVEEDRGDEDGLDNRILEITNCT
jgi:hypothetical protein